jgi:hypothetical protein
MAREATGRPPGRPTGPASVVRSFRIRARDYEALKCLAAAQRITAHEALRRAVRLYSETHKFDLLKRK